MKKILSAALAVCLTLSMSAVCFAQNFDDNSSYSDEMGTMDTFLSFVYTDGPSATDVETFVQRKAQTLRHTVEAVTPSGGASDKYTKSARSTTSLKNNHSWVKGGEYVGPGQAYGAHEAIGLTENDSVYNYCFDN